MAQSYLQFSLAVKGSEEALAWATMRLAWLSELGHGLEGVNHPEDKALIDEVSAWEVGKTVLSEESGLGFYYEREDGALYIWAEEFGDPNHVALFLQEYLRKWNPTGTVEFEYSVSCSRPRVGEFGGGAVLVYADGYDTRTTCDLIVEMRQARRK